MILDIIQFDDLPCATQRACAQRGAWHVLAGCLMLNRTTRAQARDALRKLFAIVPEPGCLAAVSNKRLLEILTPCGLGNRRLAALRAMTEDWLGAAPWKRSATSGLTRWTASTSSCGASTSRSAPTWTPKSGST